VLTKVYLERLRLFNTKLLRFLNVMSVFNSLGTIDSANGIQVMENEAENEITITVFRMLILDLLAMYHVENQAMINILGD
jgi:hypothetical protein